MHTSLEKYLTVQPYADLSLFIKSLLQDGQKKSFNFSKTRNNYIVRWPKKFNKIEWEIFYLDFKFYLQFFNYKNVHDMTLSEWFNDLFFYNPFSLFHKKELFSFDPIKGIAPSTISTDLTKEYMQQNSEFVKINPSFYIYADDPASMIYDANQFSDIPLELIKFWFKNLVGINPDNLKFND